MRFKLRSLFSLLLMIVAAYAVISARHWSFKAALFRSPPPFLSLSSQERN